MGAIIMYARRAVVNRYYCVVCRCDLAVALTVGLDDRAFNFIRSVNPQRTLMPLTGSLVFG